jgi:hypothetical protein
MNKHPVKMRDAACTREHDASSKPNISFIGIVMYKGTRTIGAIICNLIRVESIQDLAMYGSTHPGGHVWAWNALENRKAAP